MERICGWVDGRYKGGREGGRGRCLLNICIPRCRWKNIQVPRRLSIRGGFIYIMHCPSSVSVCYFIDRACDISSLFFFSLFLRFSPSLSRILSLFFSFPLFLYLLRFDLGVLARIWLVITTVSLDPRTV